MSRSQQPTLSGYKMRVIRPAASPIDYELEEGRSVFIGKTDSCGIQIKGDGVADIHCLIDVEDGVVAIQDWASDAGTKINGKPIDDKTPLQIGDSVAVGSVKIELVGLPGAGSGSKSNQQAAEVAEPPREESVGMEHLGYEDQEDGATALAEPESVDSEPVDEVHSEAQFDENDLPPIDLDEEADRFDTGLDPAGEVSSNEGDAVADPFGGSNDVETDFSPKNFSDEDLDWDPSAFDDDQVDAEIVGLLKSEIEDLRIQLAERDEQLAAMEGLQADDQELKARVDLDACDQDFGSGDLVGRVDELLAELADHDERVATLQELLQTAEVQNQAEREERNCLETWVGEIEQRIGERESEWQAEQDALRTRLESVNEERDQMQQKLHAAAQRYGGGSTEDVVPDETLKQLQKQNSELQESLEASQKQCASLTRQVDRLQNEEPESLQELRADLAKEKASVSRMRFQLSKQLHEFEDTPEPKEQPDREFALKLQTLREHLREIHEEEKVEREQRGESLFGRISNLWKRVDDEF